MPASPRKTAQLERFIKCSPKPPSLPASPRKTDYFKVASSPTKRPPPPRLSQFDDNLPTESTIIKSTVDFADDFYLNLLDYSPMSNLLVAGQGAQAVAISPETGKSAVCFQQRTRNVEMDAEQIACVSWHPNDGGNLTVALHDGRLYSCSLTSNRAVTLVSGHCDRIGTLAWNGNLNLLSSGSKAHRICHHDARSDKPVFTCSSGHRLEICGLKWDNNGVCLASGGNDNCLCVFDVRKGLDRAAWRVESAHSAAIKALAWLPDGRLLSGGGTADKKIKLWDHSVGNPPHVIQTSSQVCSLWAADDDIPGRFVSTHGFTEHHIAIWSVNQFDSSHDNTIEEKEPLCSMTGHTQRVLYSAAHKDMLYTGSGDGTIRMWRVFSEPGKSRIRRHWESICH